MTKTEIARIKRLPEFKSIESFVQFLVDDERTQYTKLEMQHLAVSVEKPEAWVSIQLKSWGLSIEEQRFLKHTRGFTTSSNDRWYGPGSSNMYGGSGAEQINGFAGNAASPAANPFNNEHNVLVQHNTRS